MKRDDLPITPEGDTLVLALPWDPGLSTFTLPPLRLEAEDLRQERTGLHGRLSILAAHTPLAWSQFNLERDEERVRLVNSAYKALTQQLNGQAAAFKAAYPVEYLKADVDGFVRRLWAARERLYAAEICFPPATPQPTAFVLHPYLVQGGGTILFAHPGRGKSWITMLMAVSIDAAEELAAVGRTPLWVVPQRHKVLFINLERSKQSVLNRLSMVNRALGLPPNRPLLMLNQRGRSLAEVLPAARRAVREEGVRVVALDSISRAGMGDLTENAPVNRIIDQLNGLTETWCGIAHAPRGSDEHLYGSIHFEAGADVVVRLLSQQDTPATLGVGLEITKENDVGKQPIGVLALEFDQIGLQRARKAQSGEFAELESGGRKPTLKEEVREFLAEMGNATATEIARALPGHGRTNISTLLKHDSDFVPLPKHGREQQYGLAAWSHT